MATAARRVEAPVERLDVATHTIPTDAPESNGTLEWDSTTLVVVHVEAGGTRVRPDRRQQGVDPEYTPRDRDATSDLAGLGS